MTRQNAKTNNDKLKEKHQKEMEEKERELERMKTRIEDMVEREKHLKEQLAVETNERMLERMRVEGMNIGGEIGNISEVTSKSKDTMIEQLPLIPGKKANLTVYIRQELFAEMKFIDEDTFRDCPKIVEEALKRMGVETEIEQLQRGEATKKEIKNCLAHRRSYVKGQNEKKYRGKNKWTNRFSCIAINI